MSTPDSCPACGGSPEQWRATLLRCSACGSATAPVSAEASAGGYAQPQNRRLARPLSAVLRLGVREQLRLLAPLGPGSRILDLGAGDGRLAATLARTGHRVTAVEPFRDVAAAPGLAVLRGRLEELELPDASFDAAVLWHVLEHLPEPLVTLERVRRWLAPGGRLLVGVPNLASLQARLGGQRWFHLDPQRHVVHYTPRGLMALLERAGFEEIRVRRVFVDQGPAGMWMTLLNRLTREPDALRHIVRREPVERRDVVVTAFAAGPLLPVAALLELAAAICGRGGAIAAVARAPR